MQRLQHQAVAAEGHDDIGVRRGGVAIAFGKARACLLRLADRAVLVNGSRAARIPNTTNLYFDYLEGESLVIALDLRGFAVSSGSACSSGSVEPSHVLLAMQLPAEIIASSLRFSLGATTTAADIDDAAGRIAGVLKNFAR